ncbi:hypothetical protein INE90_01135 [Bacteroides uniformis]|uniref:hypothetical protein n=1 Tax=Bacteroidaceae TaxID=815 RepID=UPI001BE13187|nr:MULTISPECIES: hypothetical protein [Bacteroidaceae]MBT0708807.1 hypothetical protein [Phocaeicola vulgatus]QUT34390.1 hypothetical protein INE90_01135 [Bacteroides uniformis]
MRNELYNKVRSLLERLYRLPDGSVYEHEDENEEVPADAVRLVAHVDLWNHNVEFIEQEEGWARPAVFVEFCPIRWNAVVHGVEYRAEPLVKLHVVTDWAGSSSAGSVHRDESLEVFGLLDVLHERLSCLEGETFTCFDLVESQTNHNHEDIVESIEVYQCVAFRRLGV